VDGKVINRELAWRNADRDRIRLRFVLGALSSSRLTRRYLRYVIRYDNFMFIEN
jgi:hypothetical protein